MFPFLLKQFGDFVGGLSHPQQPSKPAPAQTVAQPRQSAPPARTGQFTTPQVKPLAMKTVQAQAPKLPTMQQHNQSNPISDIANFIGNNIVKPVVDSANTVGNAYASGINYLGGELNGQHQQQQNAILQKQTQLIHTPSPNINQRSALLQQINQLKGRQQSQLADVNKNNDPVKVGAASANLLATVAAPAMSRVAAPVSKLLAPKIGALGSQIVGHAIAQVPVGAALGATSQLERTGTQSNPLDVLESAGSGALAGGLLGGAVPALARGAHEVRNTNFMDESGFLAGPGAKGFKAAQEQGRVFKGVDKKPRFEVDDSGAKLLQTSRFKRTNPLEKVLDHPKLYEQYPDLKNLPVKRDSKLGALAAYDREKDKISINPKRVSGDKEHLQSVLHELQHSIQKREGFARGASYDSSNAAMQDWTLNRLEQINKKDARKGGLRPHELDRFDRHVEELQKYKKADKEAWKQYENNAGEAEARAVENRMDMKPEDRSAKPFYKSLDVPKKDLIIKHDGGTAESRISRTTGPDGQQILKPYVKGTKAQSPEYQVPVSTHETRRQPINVTQPRGNRVTKFVAVNTLDNAEKPTYDLIPFDNKQHTLSNGTVTTKQGKHVGSFLGVDEHGNQYAYIEGKPVNITGITGDLNKWGNLNKSSHDMNRLIEANAPNKETATKVQNWVTQFKDQQEATMKTELKQRRDELTKVRKDILKAKPRGVSQKDLSTDLFRAAENKADMNQMRQKYGDDFINKHFVPTLQWSRKTYGDLLGSTNNVLQRNGFDAIPERKNYITHIQDEPGFWEKFGLGVQNINPLGGSIDSDINPGKARGGIPDEIVGNTANTNARRKFNPFAQERKGNSAVQDFFRAHDAYYEPMLMNKHMTPAASRARVVERAFRTNDKANQLKMDEFAQIAGLDEAKKMMGARLAKTNKNYKPDRRSPFVMAWQEYGNQLAGKTNAIDRTIIDAGGSGAEKLMNASAKLQGIAGASTIPGSATAALAQVLSLPQTVARDSAGSVLRGAKDMMQYAKGSKDDPLRQSAFMRARYTDASSQLRTKTQKYTHAVAKPMEMIERATGELSWRSAYNQAVKKGLTGDAAIKSADIVAKKTLAGRGIGDRPLVMNSKALGLVTQFGLEVNNMRIQFWKDFTPVQKIKFLVAAAALNTAYQAATGNAPLPDYARAIGQSVNDFSNSNDDKKDSPVDNTVQAGQRLLGETSKFIPGVQTLASNLMSDTQRQQVFGKNGDISRYGTPPLAAPITNAVTGIGNAVKGDIGGALASFTKLLPTGNQLSRSAQGAAAIGQGYQTNPQGNVQSVNDQTNPFTVPQALLFGKNSLPGQQQALNSGFSLSPKESTFFKGQYQQNPQQATDYFNQALKAKIDKSNKAGTLTNNGFDPSANAASMPTAPYPVQPTNNSTSGGNANVAQSTGNSAKSLLDYFKALPPAQHKAWSAAPNTDPEVTKSLTAWTGGKVQVQNITNDLAKQWAQYQQDFAGGKVSPIIADQRKTTILKSALGSQLDTTEKAISGLSKEQIKSYKDSGTITQPQLDKVLSVEKQQYDAGLIKQETFANKLGLTARGYKAKKATTGRKSTGTRKTKVKSPKFVKARSYKLPTLSGHSSKVAIHKPSAHLSSALKTRIKKPSSKRIKA